MTQCPDFVCPVCRSPLERTGSALLCAHCAQTYAMLEGIPVFVSDHRWREFYEGRWKETKGIIASEEGQGWGSWYREFRYQYHWQERCFFAKALHRYAPGRLILDVGCGGGQAIFARFGPTIGVDLSLSSLQNAGRIYRKVAMADIAQLPFDDDVFDVVTSVEVLGHIPGEAKDTVIGETRRVLHPGGIAIHVVETMGAVRRFAQRLDAELFERYFIQQYGHVSMEFPSETIARIEQCGFEKVYARSRWSLLWWPGHYLEGFNNEYRQRSRGVDMLVEILARLHQSSSVPLKVLRDWLGMTTGLLAPMVDRLVPLEYGNVLYTVFRKL